MPSAFSFEENMTELMVSPQEIRKERILGKIRQGIIPVVSGFQGATVNGEITTLGRGGSDTTAIAIASELGADHVCIYKDVDGVMTCDPKKSTDARFVDRISALRLLEMMRDND